MYITVYIDTADQSYVRGVIVTGGWSGAESGPFQY